MTRKHTHSDMFGKDICIGDYVVSYDRQSLSMFVVERLNPKMVTVRRIKSRYPQRRYPRDLVVLDRERAVFKLLQD